MAAPSTTNANEINPSIANSPVQAGDADPKGHFTQAADAAPPAPRAAAESVINVSLAEAEELPPVTLMSSTADIIVPWSVLLPVCREDDP